MPNIVKFTDYVMSADILELYEMQYQIDKAFAIPKELFIEVKSNTRTEVLKMIEERNLIFERIAAKACGLDDEG